eukprot:gb/GEZN01010673.1/.p1 GENE.gb/GEZN01010673.1/~~gb/GEZN01010673.1/.p1  ORF type:complete len:339 (-),score=37.89 gb/GEZN01010673.1/:134-1150(-)
MPSKTQVGVGIFALAAAIVFGWRGGLRGSTKASDATAASVAKLRHMETIRPLEGEEQRLFEDPYAAEFYPYANILRFFPFKLFLNYAHLLEYWTGFGFTLQRGLFHLLIGRTKEFDFQIQAALSSGIKQYVILGAGYDTRAFRLDIPNDVAVFEIDQHDVQEKKRWSLHRLGVSKDNVHFIPIDFNTDSLEDKLRKTPAYDPSLPTIFTMEGVTQYIPKDATARTLQAVAAVSGPGSRFVVSYVPQDWWESPQKCGASQESAQSMMKILEGMREPWISGWHPDEFELFMRKNGFEVQRDVTIRELVNEYFTPAHRHVPAQEQLTAERYVMAILAQKLH